jgi:chromosome condensin MukBEF MukE localization factor
VTSPQEESQAGPSGCIPEEGIDIAGEDSSMQVIAPEDPPVGQDMDRKKLIEKVYSSVH